MRTNLHLARALVSALLLLIAAACGTSADTSRRDSGGEPQRGGTLTYAVSNEVASLDPARLSPSSAAGSMPGYAIFDALVVSDPVTGDVSPKIADSLTADNSGRVWTLTLRAGVEFSDGTPFDADAVRYNYKRLQDPEVASIAADAAAGIKSMKAVSPTKLRIILRDPNTSFDRTVAQRMWMIGSPTAMRERGEDFGSHPVGAGPFVLEDWVRDSSKTLTRNERYYDNPRPYLDKIIMPVITDTTQSATSLKSGQTDMATYWDYKVANNLKSAGLDAVTVEVAGSPGIALNMTKAPFDDARVRLAMAKATDTEQAAEVLGDIAPAPAPFINDDDNFDMAWPETDSEGAQELFNEYADEHGPIKITIGAFQRPGSLAGTKYIQSVLNQYDNVQVEVEVKAAATAMEDVLSRSYQAHTWGTPWFGPADLARYLKTGAQDNVFGFSDPAVDRAIEKAQHSSDPAIREKAYTEIVAKLVESIPIVQYGSNGSSTVYTASVHDVEVFLDGIPYLERTWKS